MTRFEVMGILNVTPDSFSDGGLWLDPEAAIAHGLELEAQGATIIDVGGESTRPGADPVSAVEEIRRVQPVVEGLSKSLLSARISIDTVKAETAAAALEAGATIINDVTAFTGDPGMLSVAANSDCQICLMHMQGEPRTMQANPSYGDVVQEVAGYLKVQVEGLSAAGINSDRIWLDPGIGFGKTVGHNLELLNRLDELVSLGYPVLVGTSRKSFIGKITGADADDRLAGSLASITVALERGARIFRVHDVAPTVQALKVAAATLRGNHWEAEKSK